MKKVVIILGVVMFVLSCNNEAKKETKETDVLTQNHFEAVPMPSVLITGDTFPTDSTTINNWIKKSAAINHLESNQDIIQHGWAVWSALTASTEQHDNGQALRRFETWYTPEDVIQAYLMQSINKSASMQHVQRNRGALKKFNQLHGLAQLPNPDEQGVVGFVKFSPSAAQHIFEHKLLYASVLKKMIKKDALVKIPDFPNEAVTLKPVFTVLNDIDTTTGMYVMPVWKGDQGNVNRPFGSGKWNNNIYITTTGKTNAAKHMYAIDEFIHFQLDSAQAAGQGAKTGDYAVLQAMHVTTRETKRWTWQTFWWSENPNSPYEPSSALIASMRPTNQLDKSANHYAMAIAYNMVQPAQPNNGGSGDKATSLYAFNPYLEAGFDTATFTTGNEQVKKYYDAKYQLVGGKLNQFGMQTNCMSCHIQARFVPGKFQGAGHFYLTDQYVELKAPYFKSTVQLDFAWSIQGNLIDDKGNELK